MSGQRPPERERSQTAASGPGVDSEPLPATTIRLPDGREVSNELSSLLGMRSEHLLRALVAAGIESAEDLLRLTDDERRYTPGMGTARWRKVAAALPEGVELGCLAEQQQALPTIQSPPPLRAIEGGRDRPLSRRERLHRANQEAG